MTPWLLGTLAAAGTATGLALLVVAHRRSASDPAAERRLFTWAVVSLAFGSLIVVVTTVITAG